MMYGIGYWLTKHAQVHPKRAALTEIVCQMNDSNVGVLFVQAVE